MTRKERKGIKSIKRRRDIVVQAVDKGGMVVMEKHWNKEKMEELVWYERVNKGSQRCDEPKANSKLKGVHIRRIRMRDGESIQNIGSETKYKEN